MDEALARKERLKALREAAALAEVEGPAPDAEDDAGAAQQDKPVLKFRNYVVQDTKRIEHEKVAPAQPPKFEEPVVDTKPEELAQEDLLLNIAPKKANADLKRDVQPKLDKLERRTLKAMREIVEEQLKQQLQEDGPAAEED